MTAMTKDRLDTMNIESLIKHYNDTFKIGKDPMDSRDSKTKVIHSEGRHQVTADVVQVAFLDNLESQAAAALNKYKWWVTFTVAHIYVLACWSFLEAL